MSRLDPITTNDFHQVLALFCAVLPGHSHEHLYVRKRVVDSPVFFHEMRITRTLDALAKICVQHPRGQNFAVAAQLYDRKVVLTISGSLGVSVDTIKHVHVVWECMREIAHLARRGAPPTPPNGLTLGGETWADLFSELARTVYRFSFARFYHRLEKTGADRVVLATYLQSNLPATAIEDPRLRAAWAVLACVGQLLTYYRRMQDCKRSVIVDDPYFLHCMTDLWTVSCAIFEDHDLLDAIGVWTANAGVPNFTRNLYKLIEFHSALHSLDSFSRSRRIFQLFAHEFQIVALPKSAVQINLPKDVGGWRKVLNKLARRENICVWPSVENNIIERALRVFHNTSPIHTMHCEVSIVDHFTSRRRKGPPPINYIGVSKPPCEFCAAFLKTWNTVPPRRPFMMKNSSDKWYFNWILPSVGSQVNTCPIRTSLYAHISKILAKYLLKVCYARSLDGPIPDSIPRKLPRGERPPRRTIFGDERILVRFAFELGASCSAPAMEFLFSVVASVCGKNVVFSCVYLLASIWLIWLIYGPR